MQRLVPNKAGWPWVTPKTLVLICYLLAFVFSVVTPAWTYAIEKPTTPPVNPLQDDFSSDSGLWEYSGTAYRDPEKGYVVLTAPEDYKQGTIWLKHEVNTFFTAEFKYLAGGGTGADGISFMFFKQKPPHPVHGGSLSFDTLYQVAPGYGIEFDNYKNYLVDPCEHHIALIKDSIAKHLTWVEDLRTEDNAWHQVVVTTHKQGVTVTVDGETVLDWQGSLAKNWGGMALSAGTGKFNNWHLIDDFKLTVLEPPVKPQHGGKERDNNEYDDDDYNELPPDKYLKIVSYRGPYFGTKDTIPGPMFYPTANEGETPDGEPGRHPTGCWAPGDEYHRVLVVENVGTMEAYLTGVSASPPWSDRPDLIPDLATQMEVQITTDEKGEDVLVRGSLSEFTNGRKGFNHNLSLGVGAKLELHFWVKMPDVGNDYQNLTFKTNFTVHASGKN